ncbi:carbon-nitrogen hydrolase family protein [Zunongwangia pacifica]|uniref:Carbon-nitrogen hydrolase family protein n=1 Tax=Zunongwangia pacifica TaxID=2911062 RepID=A0A9X1ZQN6_9FLAO|nr:carbon-nitrogen hydrolase family protein [Zunongwangia pacifica]MCL6219222.1 carbon-nitrogen hydrolase family protein [Zunongwangia pacifica]
MKICITQTKPIKGDIDKNIEKHLHFIKLAVENKADVIVFPELSLTGYEPELAEKLATDIDDQRLDVFQKISDDNEILIGVGLPTKTGNGTCISMFIFQPNTSRKVYSKKYLHPGEEKFFVPGENLLPFKYKNKTIGIAICYETSIPEHSKTIYDHGADVYIASVLNSIDSVNKDIYRISAIAKKYKMISCMSNFVGTSGGSHCAGKSSIWNKDGMLLEQLDTLNEGIAIIDINKQETTKIQIEKSFE